MSKEPEIRGLHGDEWADALVLLEKVFAVGPWLFHSLHRASALRHFDHVSGAFVEGELVGLVDVFLRDIHGVDGMPQRVGCVGSVATHPEYRGKGLSSKLLERALHVMEDTRCVWSFLFTGNHRHYERFGWRRFETHYRSGRLSPSAPSRDGRVGRRTYFTRVDVASLMPLYEASNALRPLSTERTPKIWRHAIRERLNRPERTAFLTTGGYAVVECSESDLTVQEVCGDPATFEALAAEVHALCVENSLSRVVLRIPIDRLFDSFVGALATDIEKCTGDWSMARPIAPAEKPDDIEGLFQAPGACHYVLDSF